MSRISQQQLESYLWGAATLLRGVIDAGDYKQFIFPLLFFKRICDVYDEEYQQALDESGGDVDYAIFAENHRFQVPKGSHWREVRSKSTNVGTAIQKAMRDIEKANPDQLYGIFGDAQWTNKDRQCSIRSPAKPSTIRPADRAACCCRAWRSCGGRVRNIATSNCTGRNAI